MRLGSRRGQIVIPAMLIFPTLFLFVYLIFHTAQLSREKIRHQFAMDAAAFVEMTNYSDFLNRTAYVNGAFPMRIFEEGYGDFPAECEGKVEHCNQVMYSDILYRNGAFPRSESGKKGFSTEGKWDIVYGGAGASKNQGPPQLQEPFHLFTMDDANKFWHSFDLATEIYKLYVQIYSLLGSVEDAQYTVLKRLAGEHSFMKKSYFLNTGDQVDADALVASFRSKVPDFQSSSVVKPVCQQRLRYCGNKHLGGTGIQPYRPECTVPDEGVTLQNSQGCSQGLFQLMWVDSNAIRALRDTTGGSYPGLELSMIWTLPEQTTGNGHCNYFNVCFGSMASAFPRGRPELHTTISLMGDPANKPAVWPNPTPKFQVRQFP